MIPSVLLKQFGWQAGTRIPYNTNVRRIVEMDPLGKPYYEAEKKPILEVSFTKDPEPVLRKFSNKLDEIPALKTVFDSLTPGRQRASFLYFSPRSYIQARESRF